LVFGVFPLSGYAGKESLLNIKKCPLQKTEIISAVLSI